MIEDDTIKLLRECDAGIKMGLSAIQEVLDEVRSEGMRACLETSRKEHETRRAEIEELLEKYHDEGKEPSAMAKGMSWMKTNVKLGMDDSDKTIAELITDGCNMGVKSLARYLNQYQAAEKRVKSIAAQLIETEEALARCMREYL